MPERPESIFIHELAKIPEPVVLDLGSRRSVENNSTMRKEWVPHAKEFIGVDFQAGLDVDVVADIHQLSDTLGVNQFDAVISCSTFEHIQYPWVAAVEICRVLKPGGVVFVQTHQTYPIHAYPNDYWRFTEDGLKTLFGTQIGFEVMGTMSDFKCSIVSDRVPELVEHPSYLNVVLTAKKQGHPPSNYVWTVSQSKSKSSMWDCEQEYKRLKCQLDVIEHSNSWRMTAPLRALRRWLTR